MHEDLKFIRKLLRERGALYDRFLLEWTRRLPTIIERKLRGKNHRPQLMSLREERRSPEQQLWDTDGLREIPATLFALQERVRDKVPQIDLLMKKYRSHNDSSFHSYVQGVVRNAIASVLQEEEGKKINRGRAGPKLRITQQVKAELKRTIYDFLSAYLSTLSFRQRQLFAGYYRDNQLMTRLAGDLNMTPGNARGVCLTAFMKAACELAKRREERIRRALMAEWGSNGCPGEPPGLFWPSPDPSDPKSIAEAPRLFDEYTQFRKEALRKHQLTWIGDPIGTKTLEEHLKDVLEQNREKIPAYSQER
jgi:hypothetical protein